MTRPDPRQLILTLWLALRRVDWFSGSALLLAVLALAGWVWLLPQQRAELATIDAQLAAARRARTHMPAAPLPAPDAEDRQRLAAFQALLGTESQLERQLATLFAIAADNGLVLDRADYKAGQAPDGSYTTYQVALPLSGPYPAIRRFCEQALRAMPSLSLDEIGLKREQVGSASVEARLRFTFYLAPAGMAVRKDGT